MVKLFERSAVNVRQCFTPLSDVQTPLIIKTGGSQFTVARIRNLVSVNAYIKFEIWTSVPYISEFIAIIKF